MNLSKRSFLALQIGHISGGPSRAQRYPQTLHLQTGRGSPFKFTSGGSGFNLDFSLPDGLLSGTGLNGCFPEATAPDT